MTKEVKKVKQTAYKYYKAGIKLIDISEKLKKPYGTIKRWKYEDKWDDIEIEESDGKNKVSSSIKDNTKAVYEDVKQVLDNDKLTYEQQLFCLYYIRYFNATIAYMKAYGCSRTHADKRAYVMFKNEDIKEEIKRLKQSKLNRTLLTEDDIFQKYVEIAFSDMTDFVDFKGNKLNFCDSSQVDGTLIDEISAGKAGTKIKLLDRMKALEWLSKHMNIATDEQKLKIEYMQEKVGYLKKANEKADDTESFNITIVDADKI